MVLLTLDYHVWIEKNLVYKLSSKYCDSSSFDSCTTEPAIRSKLESDGIPVVVCTWFLILQRDFSLRLLA